METKKYQVGDFVSWTSQAAGMPKKKTGVVMAIVPAGFMPMQLFYYLQGKPGQHGPKWWKEHFTCDSLHNTMSSRQHESYLVAVPTKANRGKAILYWPRVPGLVKAIIQDLPLSLSTLRDWAIGLDKQERGIPE